MKGNTNEEQIQEPEEHILFFLFLPTTPTNPKFKLTKNTYSSFSYSSSNPVLKCLTNLLAITITYFVQFIPNCNE